MYHGNYLNQKKILINNLRINYLKRINLDGYYIGINKYNNVFNKINNNI